MAVSRSVGTASTAGLVCDDAEALELAARFAERFAAGAAERDRERRIPYAELDALSASGLLGITVPRSHGGAEVSARTLVEVFRLLAAADPNIAQIPQSHFAYVNVLRENGTAQQRQFFFGEVLAGKRFGNAQSEAGSRTVQEIQTRLVSTVDGDFVLQGTKAYSTGALLAQWIPVLAKDDRDRLQVAYVPQDAPGLTVVDDWAGMGQRTTASGTVQLDQVRVPADRVVPHHLTFDRPQLHGALAQALHAAIDVGIAGGALADAVEFVRTRSRPWGESGVRTAAEDPLTIQRFGELAVRLRAAEALLDKAGEAIDAARGDLNAESAGAASIAVATAKVFADGVAVELSSALFEVSGTRSSLDTANLHRHWRNARTHTLHDPVRWKIQHIGRYVLNGALPPRHGQI
ncbi:SfnB family sulfur acquisition oxidoreductase [Saccharopolyspora sp. K220]|uniref:SfnB family sulfur acquisition oxidoreductase n=1 Tax=Saccharopolyspora soli TaxID=2926618 RepID=UPI001F5A8064|nr:SfnB family sulfur acquisition oxidoreductase [Saccharopolyspora soli]MCI2422448.1 SfnB family sulfur acquisition oxidoreductase [Saccharopolyspora soli]